jgi:AcrR family transcriptional regulator
MPRDYRLGRRQDSADRSRLRILAAARELLETGEAPPSVARVAGLAGVSRVTVYNHFGSRAGLVDALRGTLDPAGAPARLAPEPKAALRGRIQAACARFAGAPGLHRRLLPSGRRGPEAVEGDRVLAEALAARDELRPGCSIREAADSIGLLCSFPAFDALHGDGRRSPSAVGDILMRMAGGFLA